MEKFRCLALAYEAISMGGNMPCILNAANEIVNEAFRRDQIPYTAIADIIEQTMRTVPMDKSADLDTYLRTDAEARAVAEELASR